MKRLLAKILVLLVTLLVAFLFSFEAFAGGYKIEDAPGSYVTKIVSAKNVKGLEIRLSKIVYRDSCNSIGMGVTSVLVSGDGDGLHDKYFFYAEGKGEMQTEMYCPSNKRVSETIYSKPVLIKSSMNNKIEILFIIPDGYGLDVRVVE